MKTLIELENEMNTENAKLSKLANKAVRNHSFFPAMVEQKKVAMKAYRAYWSAVDANNAAAKEITNAVKVLA